MSNTPPPAPKDDRPHKEPSDAEEVYYEGSPSVSALGIKLLLWPAAGIVMVVLPFLFVTTWKVRLICVAIGLALPWPPVLWTRTIRYRISNYRIDYERGLVSRDIDTVELWHVDDLHFHQSLWDRLMNVGDIQVESKDETIPKLLLRGLPNPWPIYETLKQRVIAVKRSRGVIKVDPG
jgi:PH (Pleckstrin Homology) domain-containing protein